MIWQYSFLYIATEMEKLVRFCGQNFRPIIVVVSNPDFESGILGSNPRWGSYFCP